MKLGLENFKNVVRDTVLVSLDLIFINEQDEVLVGRRRHGPARNYIFVPGGRVMKGETLAGALRRVVKQETGLSVSPNEVVLQGIYDHMYSDSCFEDPAISTQYVVIACRCPVSSGVSITPDQQHESLDFMPIAKLMANPQVHPYTKNYFQKDAENLFLGTVSGEAPSDMVE
jgi:colanic acid biosynthesis protein WcaH